MECWPKRREEKRILQPNFGSSFYMFFLLPLGLPYINWASQECCLFYLRSSLRSSDLSLFYFHGLFPSLSFSHCHSELFSHSNYLVYSWHVVEYLYFFKKNHQCYFLQWLTLQKCFVWNFKKLTLEQCSLSCMISEAIFFLSCDKVMK